ncbi:class I SAM-dependent methyltransferase [Sphingomonas sp.]|jgi:ubiquinone/menaquinone biosynthesis C-methylase UbiE|uniref:class I SAM-dependent methyltransferase n=1 Tax=Sphingomonas sp. TaxID=28214 RepID=UPI002D80E728|nr:class I SAM-dependent methyltransferase [Sphingomonas sp.]HEU0043451.1 class I SAM-dependent methyltransferase [Sphingomonas sp.]
MFQQPHAILPQATHDEYARQEFVATLRKRFTTDIWPGTRKLYEEKAAPAFRARHGRDPETPREAYDALNDTFYFRAGNLVGRAAQELIWDNVGESIERQLDSLIEEARPRPTDQGTVRTNPDLAIPRYIDAVDIHAMPGNFHTEIREDDVYAGALYDRGVYVFAFGGLGDQNQGLGATTAAFVQEKFPALRPRRILDLGCGPGFTTLPWKDAYPDAEVHGVDVGAPQVRYAHRRAESLGYEVHFSQQDAASLDFEDGYFDVVCSLLVTHEMPAPHIRGMFAECHRVLAPGGICLHDGGYPPPVTPIDSVMSNWFNENANEPFAVGMRRMDMDAELIAAGFQQDKLFRGQKEPVYLKGHLPPASFIGAIRE